MNTRIVTDCNGRKYVTSEPLLHPKKEWKSLTKEEVEDIEIIWEATQEWTTFAHAARAIEAQLKAKNGY